MDDITIHNYTPLTRWFMSDLRLVNSQTAQVEDWTTRNWAICKLLIYLNHIKTEKLHLSNFHRGVQSFGFWHPHPDEMNCIADTMLLYSVIMLEFASGKVNRGLKSTLPLNLFTNISRGSDILGKGVKPPEPPPPANTVLHLEWLSEPQFSDTLGVYDTLVWLPIYLHFHAF